MMRSGARSCAFAALAIVAWQALAAGPAVEPASPAASARRSDALRKGAAAPDKPLPDASRPDKGGAELQPVRGVVRPANEAVLSSGIGARITEFSYREGDAFRKDAVLVRFDCSRFQAELEAARSAYAAEKANHETQRELERLQAAGSNDVIVSRERMNERRSQAEALQHLNRNCVIRAPFDGRVAETLARASETPGAGQPLLRIVSNGAMELHLIIPSKWLAFVQAGTPFEFQVDETGDTAPARVRRINPLVDAVSQTVKVIGEFTPTPQRVLPGMSGSARFAPRDPARP